MRHRFSFVIEFKGLYLSRFSRRVNVRKARWRIAEILISPTFRAKKGNLHIRPSRPASPEASWKGEWIGSRFLGWFIFPCGLGLKIYYLCDSYLLALSRLGGIFFKLFGKRACTSTISSGSFCRSVGVSSEHKKPNGCLSHVICRKSRTYAYKSVHAFIIINTWVRRADSVAHTQHIEKCHESFKSNGRNAIN